MDFVCCPDFTAPHAIEWPNLNCCYAWRKEIDDYKSWHILRSAKMYEQNQWFAIVVMTTCTSKVLKTKKLHTKTIESWHGTRKWWFPKFQGPFLGSMWVSGYSGWFSKLYMYRLTLPLWPKVAIWWPKAKPRCLVLAKLFSMMFLQWVLGCFRIWTPIPSRLLSFASQEKIINIWVKQFRNTVIYRKHGLFSSS